MVSLLIQVGWIVGSNIFSIQFFINLIGNYENGKKVGLWTVYKENGEVEIQEERREK